MGLYEYRKISFWILCWAGPFSFHAVSESERFSVACAVLFGLRFSDLSSPHGLTPREVLAVSLDPLGLLLLPKLLVSGRSSCLAAIGEASVHPVLNLC
jgi:hypothetical protein